MSEVGGSRGMKGKGVIDGWVNRPADDCTEGSAVGLGDRARHELYGMLSYSENGDNGVHQMLLEWIVRSAVPPDEVLLFKAVLFQ